MLSEGYVGQGGYHSCFRVIDLGKPRLTKPGTQAFPQCSSAFTTCSSIELDSMIKFRFNFIICFLCFICAIAGYAYGFLSQPTYHISLAKLLDPSSDAKLFNASTNEFISLYNPSGMLTILPSSSWTNQRIHRKGSWKILLENGTNIHLSYYGNFFWIEGTKGFFLIPPNHKAAYQSLLNEIQMKTFAWRDLRNGA